MYDIQILHHDDGKEKHESHTITIKEIELSSGTILTFPTGYGASLSAARRDFNKKIDELFLDDLRIVYASIVSNVKKPEVIQVDCFGNPIKK